MKRILPTVLAALFSALLFVFPEAAARGAAHGVTVCRDTLLPTLLPFMAISSFISYFGAGELISPLFSPLTKLLRLPKPTGGIWLASFIGGFPSGAHSICALYELGALDKDFSERLIPCCVCSGPAFLVLAVGRLMLGSSFTGALLLLAQMLSVILLTAVFCRTKERRHIGQKTDFLSFGQAFVAAVSAAASSLISIFAFVMIFAVATELLSSLSPALLPLCSLLEVTLGCQTASRAGGLPAALAVAFLTGFGGVSVCFQILSLARTKGLFPRRFWTVRLLNGLLCSLLFFGLLKLFPQAQQVNLTMSEATLSAVWSVDSLLGSVCFGAMLLSAMQRIEPRRY